MSTGHENQALPRRDPPAAIDHWVKHGLQAQYSHVAEEEVPRDMMHLVDSLTPDD